MTQTEGSYNCEVLAKFSAVQDVENGYVQTWQRFRIFLLPSEISDKLFQYPYIFKAKYNLDVSTFLCRNLGRYCYIRLTLGKKFPFTLKCRIDEVNVSERHHSKVAQEIINRFLFDLRVTVEKEMT